MNKNFILLCALGSMLPSVLAVPLQRAMWAFSDGQLTDNDNGFEQYDTEKTFDIKQEQYERSKKHVSPPLFRCTRTLIDCQTGKKIFESQIHLMTNIVIHRGYKPCPSKPFSFDELIQCPF